MDNKIPKEKVQRWSRPQMKDQEGGEDKTLINSIIRAIELLNLYDKDTKALGITELAKLMGLHKSSVHRIVKTLEYMGWLEQDPVTSKYKLGMKIMDVGSTLLKIYDHHDIINQGMRELMLQVHETIVLSTYTDLCGICVDVIEAENHITYTSKLGHKTPVCSGATGKTLLAWQSEEEIQRVISCGLRRYTPNTITDEGALRRDLQKIRSRGYALSFEETDPGVGAVGAPIFDGQGRLLYGISIVGPVERLREKGVGFLAETLMEKCRDIMDKIAKIP
ncbi:IclR family transcriptional regulator [bacterium 1xD42-67]|nr:IclR family transcriptional regulator [bacterium 1xD42-67]